LAASSTASMKSGSGFASRPQSTKGDSAVVSRSEVCWQNRAMLARTSSALLVQIKGLAALVAGGQLQADGVLQLGGSFCGRRGGADSPSGGQRCRVGPVVVEDRVDEESVPSRGRGHRAAAAMARGWRYASGRSSLPTSRSYLRCRMERETRVSRTIPTPSIQVRFTYRLADVG